MIQLVKEITRGLLEQEQRTVAVYGGGFKPPTRGHLEVIKQSLDETPEIDEYIIYVGKAERDGITLEDSLKIWDIYQKYLPSKVRIEKSIQPPIKSIYDYAKEHPQDEVLWVIGAREENEADFTDIASRTKSITKYPNLELRTIVTKGGVSGTAARNAAKISPEKLNPFLPDFLSVQEKNDIFAILNNEISENINEIGDLSQSPYKWSYLPDNSDELNKEYSFTTKDSKYTVIFYGNEEGDDWDLEFLASTGIGGSSTRTLTGGNEPFKIMSTVVGIVKDFLKKSDTLIKTISYTPTKGKRGEEDAKDNTRAKLYKAVIQRQFPKAKISGEDDITIDVSAYSTPQKETLNENASYSQHIDVKQKIKELTQHMLDKGMNIKPLPKVIFKHGNAKNAKEFLGKTAYYDPNNIEIILYTEGRHPKDIVRSFSHEMIHHIQNIENRLGNVVTTNTHEDDHLNKLEAEANLRGTMTFRNWTDSTKNKSKPKNDLFGLNAFAAELGRLREGEEEYKIYLDMDGVIADFDKRFRDLSGMAPSEFESKYGKNEFWDFIDVENKLKFWVGIPPMEGAKQLVDYVSKHDYVVLTAPSIKKESRLGKHLWVRNHTGDVFTTKPTVIFKAAKEKHKVKPSLSKFDILIDDRASTIDNWDATGGTGILYQSAPQVISKLKELGL